jgi:hypothetical protein
LHLGASHGAPLFGRCWSHYFILSREPFYLCI